MKELKSIPTQMMQLSELTSIGCGGAAHVCFPKTGNELKEVLSFCLSCGIAFYPLSNGTNVLPSDAGYRGMIVCFKNMKGFHVYEGKLFAYAGESIAKLNEACKRQGYLFAPFMTGVPALVGGAIAMNAGVAEHHMEDIVRSVTATDGKNTYEFSREDCAFSNKSSIFLRERLCILQASFRIEKASFSEIEEKFAFYRDKRKHLPTGKSMGCIFRNEDTPSGKLIEECGLKGARIGGAVVSERHANFIINENQAKASDIKKLIVLVKETVFQKTGRRLTEEIQYIL